MTLRIIYLGYHQFSTKMDVKTFEITPFTDQKPGTYVTLDPAPAPSAPRELSRAFAVSNYCTQITQR